MPLKKLELRFWYQEFGFFCKSRWVINLRNKKSNDKNQKSGQERRPFSRKLQTNLCKKLPKEGRCRLLWEFVESQISSSGTFCDEVNMIKFMVNLLK